MPVLPLFGDMHLNIGHVLAEAPSNKAGSGKEWAIVEADARLSSEFEIVNHMSNFRLAHAKYLAQFMTYVNEMRAMQRAKVEISAARCRESIKLAIDGLKLLTDWL